MRGVLTEQHERVHFNLAKIKKFGITFELPVEPDLALQYKKGVPIQVRDIVKAGHIYSDAQKGLLATEADLKKVFGTTDMITVAEKLLKEGELQLTQQQREKMREEKKRKIITMIAINAVDPQSRLPHPPHRIEAAMEQARVRIDEFQSAEEQIDDIIKALRPILPIRFETKKLHLHVPALQAGRAYGAIKNIAHPNNEQWHDDGSFSCDIEIPAGIEADVYEKLNKATNSEIQIEPR